MHSPDIQPGERYPWTFPEREGQMGTFGPASIARYGGYTASVLIAVVVLINAIVAFSIARTWTEGFVFAAVAIPFSAAVAFAVVTYPYFRDRRKEDAWTVRLLIATLVMVAWVASSAALFDHVERGLLSDTFHGLFHGKQEARKRFSDGCADFVPVVNARRDVEKARDWLADAKSWCRGLNHSERACDDIPAAKRAVAEAEKDLDCALSAGNASAAAAPQWTLLAAWNLAISLFAMGLLQVGGPLLLYAASEGGKGIMMERFDLPPPAASVAEPADDPEPDHFLLWDRDCVRPATEESVLKYSDIRASYEKWCGIEGQAPLAPDVFSKRFALLHARNRKHSGGANLNGSIYTGLMLTEL